MTYWINIGLLLIILLPSISRANNELETQTISQIQYQLDILLDLIHQAEHHNIT